MLKNTYTKSVLPHPEFYIARFIKSSNLPYILFIHGGPGSNCGTIEYLIEHHNLLSSLECNIILYDQRNCGRSKKVIEPVLHQDNVNDFQKVITHITSHYNLNIHALIGHSYGAKLLFDFYNSFSSRIPGVFVSMANSILIPFFNNLMLDLSYLKKNNVELYDQVFNKIDHLNLRKTWEISEELAPIFQENKDRQHFYWANLECYNLVQGIQKRINLPLDIKTFISVRKDLYSSETNISVNIDELKVPTLWINGFHDFVMNGHEVGLSKNCGVETFYKSSHYPHIEENDLFSMHINKFIVGMGEG